MKKLIIIAGPTGIGKTTLCKELFQMVNGCAWLDGDWCWMVHPYPGKTTEQKRYAEKAFGYILDGYFNDDNTETILFSWLIHSNFMFDLVTDQIAYKNYELIKIALVCEEKEYIRRLISSNRNENQINNPDNMEKYRSLNAMVINTTNLSVTDTIKKILHIIKGERK